MLAVQLFHALLVVQDFFADAHVLGRDFQKLVFFDEFKGFLYRHYVRRDEAQRIVRTRGTRVGQLLLFTDVDRHVLTLGRASNYHPLIYLDACANKQRATLLRIKQAVGNGFASLKCNQRAS